MKKKNFFLTCKRCGWVHFGVTLEEAEKSIIDFNKYFRTLDEQGKENFGGKGSDLADYCLCFRCGAPHTEFRRCLKKEFPNGSTIQPILMVSTRRGIKKQKT